MEHDFVRDWSGPVLGALFSPPPASPAGRAQPLPRLPVTHPNAGPLQSTPNTHQVPAISRNSCRPLRVMKHGSPVGPRRSGASHQRPPCQPLIQEDPPQTPPAPSPIAFRESWTRMSLVRARFGGGLAHDLFRGSRVEGAAQLLERVGGHGRRRRLVLSLARCPTPSPPASTASASASASAPPPPPAAAAPTATAAPTAAPSAAPSATRLRVLRLVGDGRRRRRGWRLGFGVGSGRTLAVGCAQRDRRVHRLARLSHKRSQDQMQTQSVNH